ncbi:MAG TPA: hypothetical protein ENH00_04565 [Actinobacteria bacterium]|nr:hypothetical protein BMS3Bbin01_03021 [bacterium BMS3Bbin01]HDH25452.1 hypothetical protein [Actinomycetota bacterium]
MYAPVSSADWGLAPASSTTDGSVRANLGVAYDELERRCRLAVYEFLCRCYDEEAGALHHYYRADTRELSGMDSGNFLMALCFLTMYDRYGDESMLRRAERCYRWAYDNCTETHPMFTWQGGVRDEFAPAELYTKYTSDALTTCAVLHLRAPRDEYLHHAAQYHNFLKQAREAGFMATYHRDSHRWTDHGFSWNTFGAPAIAYLELREATGDDRFLEHAKAWVDHGLELQADDGAFYLLDDTFWNSDLTALELRALVFVHELTGEGRYLEAAVRFAGWLLGRQREDGAWPIGIDRDGEVVAPNVGPGDMPNIAMSLVRLHQHTGDERHLEAAVRACRYAIGMQAIPEGRYPEYLDDPHVKWGFWSWEPLYDHSLSGDQLVHHVRGLILVADYLASCETDETG